jgi:hypothetical protein
MRMWIDVFICFIQIINKCVQLFLWPFTGILWRIQFWEQELTVFGQKSGPPFSKSWIRPCMYTYIGENSHLLRECRKTIYLSVYWTVTNTYMYTKLYRLYLVLQLFYTHTCALCRLYHVLKLLLPVIKYVQLLIENPSKTI